MKLPFTVDREQFIAWTEGILLDRNEKGEVLLVNEKNCKEADDRLNNGEEVYLTVGNEIVSKMYLNKIDGCIVEVECEKELTLK